MLDPRDSDQDLADDIGFGLWRHGRLKIPIEVCRMIGAAVVAHLRLAGWRLQRWAPFSFQSCNSAREAMPGNL
jgi:hypothetical protein